MDLEKLYQKLPIFAQHLACTMHGARLRLTRYDSKFYDYLRQAEQRTYWPADRLREFRDNRLKNFVSHCAKTMPFYQKRLREWGIRAGDIKTLADLPGIPLCSKQEIQDHYQEMLSNTVPLSKCIIAHTSGTTGGGLRFAVTPEAYREQWSIWWRYRRWHGIDLGTSCGYFGGRSVVPLSQREPPFWRYDAAGRQTLFSGYHMSPETMASYREELDRRRPEWLNGYPSLLALLANYLVETGRGLGYRPRLITTLAENLMPHQRAIIEKAFGVRPRQHYGMAEGAANISECELGRLHVDEDFSAVEFLPTTFQGVYRVIGTGFSNYALGFLRYEVQDTVRLAAQGCPCGRAGRVVETIDGREEDYVVLKNGAHIGRLDHIFKDLVKIREAQIYQDRPGVVVLKVVRGPDYGESDERQLREEAIKRLGTETRIIIEYVVSLMHGPTGKLRFVVSKVDKGKTFLQG